MPLEGPGQRLDVPATKATTHGAPACELHFPGIAAKSAQIAPMAPSVANAALAQQIAIGEHFTLMLAGVHEVAVSALPGGAVAGDLIWIKESDNSLANAATASTGGVTNAGYLRLGRLQSIDTVLGRALINLNVKVT